MNIFLDILSSGLIGGMVLLMVVQLNLFSSQKQFASDQELHLQQNAKTLAEIIENDIRKVGFNYSGTAVITAEPKEFSFYADIDSNGTVDRVTYCISDSTVVPQTENPHDKVLYRVVNGDTSKGPSLGITDLRFTYKDMNGNIASTHDKIKFLKAEIWVESPEKTEGRYLFTYWEMTINPRNI